MPDELDDWASQVGYRQTRRSSVGAWLDSNPDRQAQIIEARTRGWSWKRICDFLRTKGFPYTANPLQREAESRGIR
jgi:hypothetical protein